MASLATLADIQVRLTTELTADEMDRVDALLAGASARVRSYTGQQFTHETTTDRLPLKRGRITLPQRPVLNVTDVTDTSGNVLAFDWYAGNIVEFCANPLNWWEIEPRRCPLSWVDVTYEHGYDTVPPDVVEVVCQIVLRAYGQSAASIGLTSESLGSYSYSVGSAAASGALGMLPDERATLDVYRRPLGTARIDW